MATSFSYTTPNASFSITDPAINRNQNDENQSGSSNQYSFHSLSESTVKRKRTITATNLSPVTTDDRNIQYSGDDDHLLGLHYESNRSKQQKLLFVMNIFRLIIIFIFAPLMYFLV